MVQHTVESRRHSIQGSKSVCTTVVCYTSTIVTFSPYGSAICYILYSKISVSCIARFSLTCPLHFSLASSIIHIYFDVPILVWFYFTNPDGHRVCVVVPPPLVLAPPRCPDHECRQLSPRQKLQLILGTCVCLLGKYIVLLFLVKFKWTDSL